MFLEGNQSGIVQIGASHIKLEKSFALSILDGLPKQKGHCAQVVESLIGAAVLVNHGLLVAQCEHASNSSTVLRSYADLALIAKAVK